MQQQINRSFRHSRFSLLASSPCCEPARIEQGSILKRKTIYFQPLHNADVQWSTAAAKHILCRHVAVVWKNNRYLLQTCVPESQEWNLRVRPLFSFIDAVNVFWGNADRRVPQKAVTIGGRSSIGPAGQPKHTIRGNVPFCTCTSAHAYH